MIFKTLDECKKKYKKDQVVVLCNVKQIVFYAKLGCQPLVLGEGYDGKLIAVYDKAQSKDVWNKWRSNPH